MTKRVVLVSKSGPNLSGFKVDYSKWQTYHVQEPRWLRVLPTAMLFLALACLALCAWAQVEMVVAK